MIGPLVRITGDIECGEDLYVNGEVEGYIHMPGCRLTVGPEARVHANVIARDVVIEGKLEGDLEVADKLEIRSAATLLGDLRTARIRIDDGGCFKGNIDILSPETEGATMVAGQAAGPPAETGEIPLVDPNSQVDAPIAASV